MNGFSRIKIGQLTGNSKFQVPNSKEAPNSKLQPASKRLQRLWSLVFELIWNLEFGTWNFRQVASSMLHWIYVRFSAQFVGPDWWRFNHRIVLYWKQCLRSGKRL